MGRSVQNIRNSSGKTPSGPAVGCMHFILGMLEGCVVVRVPVGYAPPHFFIHEHFERLPVNIHFQQDGSVGAFSARIAQHQQETADGFVPAGVVLRIVVRNAFRGTLAVLVDGLGSGNHPRLRPNAV